jgi:hypothetical protein
MFFRWIIWVLLGSLSPLLTAQSVSINELMSANISYFDDFDESSDWIELYNPGLEIIQLKDWGLSDDNDPENCWKFGDVELPPGEFLMIRASDRDINYLSHFKSIIREGDQWQYLIPSQSIANSWKTLGYDDSGWESGTAGFGYGDEDDQTLLPEGTRSVFLRKTFHLENTENILELLAHIDYDDAFVAYLNGIEVARANIGSPGDLTPYWESATTDHEAQMYEGGEPILFDLSNFKSALNTGENVLAVQVHNVSSSSSDMSFIPFLTLKIATRGENDFPEIFNFPETSLHANFKLSSGGETLYLFSNTGIIMDSITFPPLEKDISYGRSTEGADDWVLFKTPSPGSANGGEIYGESIQDSVHFSHPSAYYPNTFFLSLSGADSIYYTLDASEPSRSSTLYEEEISIYRNSFIQAKIIQNGKTSDTYSASFMLTNKHQIPVISLHTEQKYLWDNDIGMYVLGDDYEYDFPYFGANFWEDWEYPFHLQYFDETGVSVYDTWAGAKIFGGWSRALDQKSFSLFARSLYGDSAFDYPFFSQRPYDEYEALILRNGGNDWDRAFVRDVVMTSLMSGSSVDFQAFQPVVCYLNGIYWGVYNMREKTNEHFIASLHDVDPEEVDLLELNGIVKNGDNSEYLALIDFLEKNSLANYSNYQYVTDQIDEVNFIEYFMAQIYYNNTDWPGNNIRYWKVPGGKWRWILYDMDFGLNLFDSNGHNHNTLAFALQTNGPSWPNPPWSTFLLRKMLESPVFKQKFVNYFADNLNSRFLPGNARAHLEEVLASYNNELTQHRQRWGLNSNNWLQSLNAMRSFLDLRPNIMRSHLRTQFGFPGSYQLTLEIEESGSGKVVLNSLTLDYSEWSGYYFVNNPIQLTAKANPGYNFDHWSGDFTSDEASITLNPSSSIQIKAHFKAISTQEQPIVINEINYHSPDYPDASDWVELYNASDEKVDLSGWIMKDDDDDNRYWIPDGTEIEADSFLVLCRDLNDFRSVYPEVGNILGTFDFGLSSSGDAVRLYNAGGELMDSVAYLPTDPWPSEANGKGPTLELISPELDNALAKNWKSFDGLGTPGAKNHFSPIDTLDSDVQLMLYPNPVLDDLFLELFEEQLFFESIAIYTYGGKLVERFEFPLDTKREKIDVSFLERGLYLLVVKCREGRFISKLFEKY